MMFGFFSFYECIINRSIMPLVSSLCKGDSERIGLLKQDFENFQ